MVDAVVALVLDKLTALISSEFGVFFAAKKELQNLKSELEAIRSTLKVADGLPYFLVEGVKDWLQKLKAVAYDAEDIIDEYQANNERKMTVNEMKQVCCKFTNFACLFDKNVHLRHKLGKDIRAISERLAQISKEKDRYNLHEFASQNKKITTDRATTRFLVEEDIIGRDRDKEVVVKNLVAGEAATMGGTGCNVSIISIVGIGGLGKTTLAKMVFNDCRVKKHFGESMWWVSILQRPNAQDVTKKILEQVNKNGINITELNTLTELLHPTITKNKFLLVLDDVWDLDWWEEVEPLLKKGAPGSKIIITTRKKHISYGIGAVYTHELESFTLDESWELFLVKALMKGETEEDLERQNLKEIGRNIVMKCGGLPLAVRTVGKVMQSKKRTREDWEFIANSKIWDWKMPASSTSGSSFLPGLILSYDDLPSLLKHYFVYFSLCQKGDSIHRQDLVMNLMAHRLADTANETDVEVAANHHIDDMLGRCLFQLSHSDRDGFLQMHDTIHDLATHIAEDEYTHNFVNENTRHLAISEHLSSLDKIGLQRNKILRTLLCLKPLPENPLDKYINNLKRLRVLDLTGGNFTTLPDSIGDLCLLKHLDLMRTKVKELPPSIGKLQGLLSLSLDGSEIKELCKEIAQLCNLRHLGLENTSQLKFVAEGLGALTCLRTLSRFILCDSNERSVGCNIKELKNLRNLRGKLTIENLERISKIDDASEALLQEKEHVEILQLAFQETPEIERRKISEAQGYLLQQLQLPPNLKSLTLTRYCGERLPAHWIDRCVHLETIRFQSCSWTEKLPTFRTIKYLHLYDCHHLKALATCPCLEELVLDGCVNIRLLPFCPKLENVELINLDNWEGFEKGVGQRLKELKISNCPKVKKLPYFPSLQRMEIKLCEELSALQEQEAESEMTMHVLTELIIHECHALQELPNMPTLHTLKMQECDKLKQLPFMGKLERLIIGNCKNWEGWSFGKEKDAILPCLRELKIDNCQLLKTLPCLPSLTRMEVFGCKEFHAPWKEDEQPNGLEELQVLECPNMTFQVDWLLPLTRIRKFAVDWSLHWSHVITSHIAALQRPQFLTILGMPGQSPLPEWLWRLSGLQTLGLGVSEATSLQGSWQNMEQLEFLAIGRSPELITVEDLFKQPPHSGEHQAAREQCSSQVAQFSVPPKLEDLEFLHCPKLKLLPDGLQHLVHLKTLALNNMPELLLLPQNITSLPKLEVLEIEDCPKLASLPAGLEAHLGNGLRVSGNCPALLRDGVGRGAR
ncbi:unnamed protein product [Victoria cruziana]